MNLLQHVRKFLGLRFKPDPFVPSQKTHPEEDRRIEVPRLPDNHDEQPTLQQPPPVEGLSGFYEANKKAIEEIRERWRQEEKARVEDESYHRRLRILRRDGFHCQSSRILQHGKPCQYPDGFKRRSRELHVHHIIPRSEGGTDGDDNLITVCHICHRRMGESHCGVTKMNSAPRRRQGRRRRRRCK